ncbi:protein-glutamate methylesterase/protein-glutamine glutaminase [Dethiothermospora halolimnae]|uniref:protein-glutamate methylesterase/protein-glutamine glutaminase n=1 Tax=Dethiothermospora halolimnae TaxID=3114390 RepID=UPI003CCB9A60
MGRKIKVLIVDDSVFFRKMLKNGLSKSSELEVVDTASDPYDARDKIIKYRPDVMTLDVEMPKMDGIEFLRRLIPQYPMPVIMLSSMNDKVFDALDAGAVDFVAKPNRTNNSGELFIDDLILKIKAALDAKPKISKTKQKPVTTKEKKLEKEKITMIAMGASTGGTTALSEIITQLPSDMPGMVLVQHMPKGFTKMYGERLNKLSRLEVKEAVDGDIILPGRVLIAPGGYQMVVRKYGSQYKVVCSEDIKCNGHRPSVDILFNSVADKVGGNTIGVILTGMGGDGAKGLLQMRKRGAKTIGQDEKTSTIYGMPRVAYEIGAVEKQVPLSDISSLLYRWSR